MTRKATSEKLRRPWRGSHQINFFLTNILLGGPEKAFVAASKSYLHKSEVGSKANLVLHQSQREHQHVFFPPLPPLAQFTFPTAQRRSPLIIISNNVSLAHFISGCEFRGLIEWFTVLRGSAELSIQSCLTQEDRWLLISHISAEYALSVSN